jgi:hypothetical protein
MPLPFGTGELATRLRRAFDIRGRIPLMADEVVVPVAIVSDVTRAPYRRSGRVAYAHAQYAPAAGEVVTHLLVNGTNTPQVIESARFSWSGVAAATMAMGLIVPTGGTPVPFNTTELVVQLATGAVAYATAPGLVGVTLMRTSTPGSSLSGSVMAAWEMPSSAAAMVVLDLPDLDVVIPPLSAIGFNFGIADTAVRGTFRIRYLDDVPRVPE